MSIRYAKVAANPNVAVYVYALRRVKGVRDYREYSIQYLGRPEDLIALGAATAAMIAPARKGARRKDRDGSRFQRCRLPSGKVRLTFYKRSELAMLMPGVTTEIMEAADVECDEREAEERRQHERRKSTEMSEAEKDWHMGQGYAHAWGERLVCDESVPDAERAAAVREFYSLTKSRSGVFPLLQSPRDWPLSVLLQRLRGLPLYGQARPALRLIKGGLS